MARIRTFSVGQVAQGITQAAVEMGLRQAIKGNEDALRKINPEHLLYLAQHGKNITEALPVPQCKELLQFVGNIDAACRVLDDFHPALAGVLRRADVRDWVGEQKRIVSRLP